MHTQAMTYFCRIFPITLLTIISNISNNIQPIQRTRHVIDQLRIIRRRTSGLGLISFTPEGSVHSLIDMVDKSPKAINLCKNRESCSSTNQCPSIEKIWPFAHLASCKIRNLKHDMECMVQSIPDKMSFLA